MKKFFILSLVLLLAATLYSGYAHATVFPTPPPYLGLTFGADVESGIFSHSGHVLSIELLDLGDIFGTASAFGFYFVGDDVTQIANLHPIFELADGPSLPFPTQASIINFNLGLVIDLDSWVIQNTFTPSLADIGFWVYPLAGAGFPVLFTDPLLNTFFGGMDVSGTFPITNFPGSDDYLITFYNPINTEYVLTAHFVKGVVPVPEPSTLLCLASGLGGLLIYRRRKIE